LLDLSVVSSLHVVHPLLIPTHVCSRLGCAIHRSSRRHHQICPQHSPQRSSAPVAPRLHAPPDRYHQWPVTQIIKTTPEQHQQQPAVRLPVNPSGMKLSRQPAGRPEIDRRLGAGTRQDLHRAPKFRDVLDVWMICSLVTTEALAAWVLFFAPAGLTHAGCCCNKGSTPRC
jgi:hypothetical protein